MRLFKSKLYRWLLVISAPIIAILIFVPGYIDNTSNKVVDHTPYSVSDAAQKLHDDLLIGDWHADALLWKRDPAKRHKIGQVDLPRLLQGNVTLQMFTAVTKSPAGQNYDSNSADARDNITLLAVLQMWPPRTWQSLYHRALYQAKRLHKVEDTSDGFLKIIRSEADLNAVLAARAAGQKIVGGLLGIEGARPLEGDITKLQGLQDAGYRMIALHHFFDNELGGSLHGQDDHALTDFGRIVVREVVKRDLILDLAHSSHSVVKEVLNMTDIPLVLSHTGIHSHCPVKRNIPDALMQDIAASGGVIAIGYWQDVTCDDSPAGIAKTIKAAINLVGEDHVSLGSDFDGAVTTRFDTSELSALTQALLDTGIPEDQIRKVMGENMVRVLRARLP